MLRRNPVGPILRRVLAMSTVKNLNSRMFLACRDVPIAFALCFCAPSLHPAASDDLESEKMTSTYRERPEVLLLVKYIGNHQQRRFSSALHRHPHPSTGCTQSGTDFPLPESLGECKVE